MAAVQRGTLMREQNNIPFAGKPVKMRYMWRDLERQRRGWRGLRRARRRIQSIPMNSPTASPRWLRWKAGAPEFTRAAYDAWFCRQERSGKPRRAARRSPASVRERDVSRAPMTPTFARALGDDARTTQALI